MADMTDTELEPWRRLGRAVDARLDELGVDPAEVQALGGPRSTKLRELRNGRADALRKSLRPGLERALRWTPGDIEVVLRGGDPTPVLVDVAATLPPLAEVPHYRGMDALKWRMVIERKLEADRTEEERAWLAADKAEQYRLGELGDRQGGGDPILLAGQSEQLNKMVALSFLADEVDSASSIVSPEPDDDPGDIENYISEVDTLVSAADELADAVHETVLDAFRGDVARLRQMKREVRRRNLAKQGIVEMPLVAPELDTHQDEEDPAGAEPEGNRRRGNQVAAERVKAGRLIAPAEEGSDSTRVTIVNPTDDTLHDVRWPPLDEKAAARKAPPGYTPGQSEQGDASGEESQDAGLE